LGFRETVEAVRSAIRQITHEPGREK
jgi:hypothetical protein